MFLSGSGYGCVWSSSLLLRESSGIMGLECIGSELKEAVMSKSDKVEVGVLGTVIFGSVYFFASADWLWPLLMGVQL